MLGIWPSGDFRGHPSNPTLTHILALLVVAGAIFAAVMAWRRGRLEVVVALATGVFACLVYVERASPWVAGKALASASPLVLGIGLAGVAVVIESGRRIEGGVVLAVLGAAVLWSTTLQYRAVHLAPGARLAELADDRLQVLRPRPRAADGVRVVWRSSLPPRARRPDGERTARRPDQAPSHPGLRPGDTSGGACNGVSPDVDEIRLDALLPFKHARHSPDRYREQTTVRVPPRLVGALLRRLAEESGAAADHRARISRKSFPARCSPGLQDGDAARTPAAAAHTVSSRRCTAREVTVITPRRAHRGPEALRYHYGEPHGLVHGRKAYTLNLPFTVGADGTYGVWVGGSFSSDLLRSSTDTKSVSSGTRASGPATSSTSDRAHLAPGTPHARDQAQRPGLGSGQRLRSSRSGSARL